MWRIVVTAVALLVVVPVMASPAAAAGQTSVSIEPVETSVDVDQSTTFEVVVDDADGGVGAAEFSVVVDDPSVATITDVTVLGSGMTETGIAEDGSSVDVEYAFRDTDDTGSVTVAEVTIEGISDGSTGIGLAAATGNDGVLIFDEIGTGYDVTGASDATLNVAGDEPEPNPANFQVSNPNAPESATQGDAIDISADIENTGEQTATQSVEFRLDVEGDGFGDNDDVVLSQSVELDSGQSTTVEFTGVDTSSLAPGNYTHGVFTENDSATATLSVEEAEEEGLQPVDGFENAPTDPDGDGLYEDVNGDGEFDIVDVQALFTNFEDDDTIRNNPDKFDFNQDGTVDVVDVQRLFTGEVSK